MTSSFPTPFQSRNRALAGPVQGGGVAAFEKIAGNLWKLRKIGSIVGEISDIRSALSAGADNCHLSRISSVCNRCMPWALLQKIPKTSSSALKRLQGVLLDTARLTEVTMETHRFQKIWEKRDKILTKILVLGKIWSKGRKISKSKLLPGKKFL